MGGLVRRRSRRKARPSKHDAGTTNPGDLAPRLARRRSNLSPHPLAARRMLSALPSQLWETAAHHALDLRADPVGPVEVGEHEDVEQLGAGERG